MTKQELKDLINQYIDEAVTHENNMTLQESVNATDNAALALDTVNPDTVKYPPIKIK